MSVRVWIDEEEVLRKPSGPLQVDISAGWSNQFNEHQLEVAFRVYGKERSVVIGGNDLERVFRTLAAYPYFRNFVHPEYLAQIERRHQQE
ncbi:hypothetical protein GGR34_000240 [Microvirga flocculans]|uniref:Uncharacterized protein n=1 Tax=Microvirga flocculans TaxID=217168 RepID=A0A7W6N6E9_9HYPH|nr:hypothetical protein [Microvirga flocculans]MBB4038611.1 hypothetical protein [Microvirga flocculans]